MDKFGGVINKLGYVDIGHKMEDACSHGSQGSSHRRRTGEDINFKCKKHSKPSYGNTQFSLACKEIQIKIGLK